MELIIKGDTQLKGEVEVSSSKNAILPILAASLLSDEKVVINKVPSIKDVFIICEIIQELGVKVEQSQGKNQVYWWEPQSRYILLII